MITIIKLGGAPITDKNEEKNLRVGIINDAMSSIAESGIIPLIIHGAGSFGHIKAKKYDLRHGYSETVSLNEQRKGISKVKSDLKILDGAICNAANFYKLNPFTLSISTMLVSNGDNKEEVFLPNAIDQALKLGMMPILSGDIVFDIKTGFRVISGDRIIKIISKYFIELGLRDIRVIFGSDIDGLYEEDPKINPNSKLLREINPGQLDELLEKTGESAGVDITGGMRGKLMQIKEIVSLGVEVTLVNLTKKERLREVLDKKISKCTVFSPY